jgi:hypothetical protein
MANTVEELVNEFNDLITVLKEMQEKGQEPGQSSLSRAVDTQVGILSNAFHRSKIDCGALEYAKQYGSVEPGEAAEILRKIAAAIDNSRNPQCDLVIEDIKRVIAGIS